MDNQQPVGLSNNSSGVPVSNSSPTSAPTPIKHSHAHKLILIYVAFIVVAAIAGGIYTWQHNKVIADNKQIASLTTQVTGLQKQVSTLQKTASLSLKTPTNTSTTLSPISSTAVSTLLTNFYNQYISVAGKQSLESQLVQQNGTSNLQAYFTPKAGYSYPEDPILCAQDIPSGITVSNIVTTNKTATATVVEGFKPPGNIKVSLVSDSTGSLKIDSITCTPPDVASQGSP